MWDQKGYPLAFLSNENAVYLFDPPGNRTTGGPYQVPAFTIVAASPNKAHYHALQKSQKACITFYKPVWTRQEIECVAEEQYMGYSLSKDTISARFDLFGGIPRYIFWQTKKVIPSPLEAELNNAVARLNVQKLDWLGDPEVEILGSDMLVHFNPKLPRYDLFTPMWSSRQVANRVLGRLRLNEAALSHYLTHLAWVANSNDEKLVGTLFELAAHQQLVKKKSYYLWRDGHCKPFHLPNLNRVDVDELVQVSHFENGTYYASHHSTMAYVNNQVFWFHMTVIPEQEVNEEVLNRGLDHVERYLPGVQVTFVLVTSKDLFENGVYTTPSQPTLFTQALSTLAKFEVKPAILCLAP